MLKMGSIATRKKNRYIISAPFLYDILMFLLYVNAEFVKNSLSFVV